MANISNQKLGIASGVLSGFTWGLDAVMLGLQAVFYVAHYMIFLPQFGC